MYDCPSVTDLTVIFSRVFIAAQNTQDRFELGE
jgi:hypothetical protein